MKLNVLSITQIKKLKQNKKNLFIGQGFKKKDCVIKQNKWLKYKKKNQYTMQKRWNISEWIQTKTTTQTDKKLHDTIKGRNNSLTHTHERRNNCME